MDDIVISNKTIKFKSLSYPLPITNQDVRTFIKKLDYWYPRYPQYGVKYKDYENAEIPNQAFVFYLYLARKHKIPTLTDYCRFYFDNCCILINKQTFKFRDKYWTGQQEHGLGLSVSNNFPVAALVGRLARAYTTFLREYELLTRLMDAGYKVSYSFVDDKFGVDLKVYSSKWTYCVKEFVATKSSLAKLSEKNMYAREKYGQKTIYLPLYMSGEKKNVEELNNIYLYDDNAFQYLSGLANGTISVKSVNLL